MTTRSVSALMGVFILLTLGVQDAVAQGKPGSNPGTLVVSERVEAHEISQSIQVIGKLESKESVIIAPEVQGKISRIHVRANQDVRVGQLLLSLDDDKAKAALIEANAYLKDEQRQLQELERLAERKAVSLSEVDAQRTSVDIAQARLSAAEASLQDMYLTAPFAGTVGFVDFSLGKMVSPGSELFTLDNLSTMRLDLQVPERHLSRIRIGDEVSASSNAWPNRDFIGKIAAIDTRINTETLNLKVRVDFPNPEGLLKPGMLMSAHLAFPAIEAPIIPVQALQYSGTKRYVYVIDEEDVAHRREVFLGARVENEVVIEKGLEIGERIVVQGLVNMRGSAQPIREQQ